ncbi:hypothetical protein NEUTE1DRAFT_102785 [Neurospora tetrasperma FGSC 2508]|uniref:Uncharacterized protein n=1 Tax=Neurospora tetrasperma (strain FGSC 2508 / ATCC MYA-4615 / P0657) TaxID=510951 RepID=F8MTM0_NEUT8|nr:uncharacterized protein NEUTE1DRAFT_102785 [Neurospora tetrasperma FGSC 2508]EGO55352.1 hypothetical protein NEUTE1DRAFT_102785 [Neurospora tetrasperma FGSC 2508]EGZ69422.1 hypothetical protein NEUTE2DRAFT_71773 [Neurospora tetrasperma FGSC 2509]
MSDDDWDDDYTSDDVEYDDDPYEYDDDGDQEEEVVEEEDEDANQTEDVEEIDDDNGSEAEGENDDEDQERGTGSMSNYEYAKPWGGTGEFMDSYGIERTPEGYQEANEMVDTMREAAEREGDSGRRK